MNTDCFTPSTEPLSPEHIEREKAAYALHSAQAWPEEEPEVKSAQAAVRDIYSKHKGKDIPRDQQRVLNRYHKIIAEKEVDLVAHAKSLGLL